MSIVTLVCVQDGKKLRVKFHSFTDEKGVVFSNVYDSRYNCKFPRNIRVKDTYYEIPHTDIALSKTSGTPYYSIKKNNIKVLDKAPDTKLFKVDECVICLDAETNVSFLPCGHVCTCKGCYDTMRQQVCPLCRRNIIRSLISII